MATAWAIDATGIADRPIRTRRPSGDAEPAGLRVGPREATGDAGPATADFDRYRLCACTHRQWQRGVLWRRCHRVWRVWVHAAPGERPLPDHGPARTVPDVERRRSEEHTSELQSQSNLVC